MKLFGVYGKDCPPRDASPFKLYLVIAPDETTAQRHVPGDFAIRDVRASPDLLELKRGPSQCGWIDTGRPLPSADRLEQKQGLFHRPASGKPDGK